MSTGDTVRPDERTASWGASLHAPAASDVLETLEAIWREALPPDAQRDWHEQVLPPTASFVALGGDSLRATLVRSRIRAAFGVAVARTDLLGGVTLAELAERIAALRGPSRAGGGAGAPDASDGRGGHAPTAPARPTVPCAEGTGARLMVGSLGDEGDAAGDAVREPEPIQQAIQPLPRDGRALPASSAQERFWLLDQVTPGNPASTIPVALRLAGRLDTHALGAALQALVERHEVLRTTLAPADGALLQRIVSLLSLPALTVRPEDDCAGAGSLADCITRARARAREEARTPFDLAKGPLLRARLLRLAPDDHVLLLTLHHTIADAWSVSLLVRELAQLYPAALGAPADGTAAPAGQPWWEAVLPRPALQYADYAAWQRGQAGTSGECAAVAYWERTLAGAPREIALPADFSPQAAPTSAGAHQTFALPEPMSARLRALCRAEGATPAAGLLAAFTALLSRYSGQDDLVVGVPLDGRERPEVQALQGLFVNTVVIRATLAGTPSFRAHLRQTRNTLLAARVHGEVPFEQVVRALAPDRSAAQPGALFNVMFAFQDAPLTPPLLPGLRAIPFEVETGAAAAMFDLTLELWDPSGGRLTQALQPDRPATGGWDAPPEAGPVVGAAGAFHGRFEYRTDLFQPATVARMAGHLTTLLEGALAHPDVPIADLPLLTPGELAQLQRWNATELPPEVLPADRRIHELIAEQARRTPDAPALVASAGTHEIILSYAALLDAAGALVPALHAAGVGPDERVAVLLERSPAWVIAQLAAHLAGGGYVALDPAQPAERLADMLLDARPRAISTTRALAARLPFAIARGERLDDLPAQLLCLEPASGRLLPPTMQQALVPLEQPLARRTRARPPMGAAPAAPRRPTADDLAYVVYTSGSTGMPKGVCIPHRGLENLVAWYRYAFGLRAGDRCTSLAGVGFDATVWELWPALAAGAGVWLVDDETRMDPDLLQAFLLRQRITVAFVPTPLAERLLALPWPRTIALRAVTTGGDRLHCYAPAELPFALFNCYGPSETSVCATAATVATVPSADARLLPTPPIGWPIGNVQCYVLDAHQQLVPTGVPGELYVGGDGLARGYLHRPELTEQRFVPNPFFGAPGHPSPRLYRTGDLVRWRGGEHGLEFLGRLDTQIKIRGYRIEAGEVETQLLSHPAVRAVVVVAEGAAGAEAAAPAAGTVVESRPGVRPGTVVTGSGESPAEPVLVAYLERQPDLPAPAPADLRRHLLTRLPHYMVPARFVILDTLPLTANGKLDRRAVQRFIAVTHASDPAADGWQAGGMAPTQHPAPHTGGQASWGEGGAAEPPSPASGREPGLRDPVEEVLRALWREVLGSDRTGGEVLAARHDESFFVAGGNSLQAAQLLARVRQALQVPLELARFFDDPTIGGMLAAVARVPPEEQEVIRRRAAGVLALWVAASAPGGAPAVVSPVVSSVAAPAHHIS